ncbi:MAG: hypothetical protein JRN68_05555, partial [Nitrososphaerota archaeon]|nr:hypothetical protein [Nitrososphaerota archaeon]
VYFHRVGRTARAGSSGKSISIIQPDDFPNFYRAQHLTKTIIKPLTPLDEQKALHPNTRRQQSSFIRYGGSRPYRRTGYQHAWQSYRRR